MDRARKFHWSLWLVLVVTVLGCVAVVIIITRMGVRVVDSSPVDGSDGVPITTPIRLTFSQPMDAASVEARLHLEPEVPGHWLWAENAVTFHPRGALAPDTTYTVTLGAGSTNQRGRSLSREHVWRFRTRTPSLLYLGRPTPGADQRQLYLATLDGGRPRQLTGHPDGVWDFAVHPQGEAIVYSVLRQDGGSDLWRMERDGADQQLFLVCPEAACLAPAWSPDGRLLAYERRGVGSDGPDLDPKAGRIWLLDLENGQDRPLFDYDLPAHSPLWSPDGGHLAYLSPLARGVEIYDLEGGELAQFGNEWGAAPSWSPDGAHLVMSDLVLVGGEDGSEGTDQTTEHGQEALLVHLVRFDLDQGALSVINGPSADLVKDVAPAWSPAGDWIAFGRQFLDGERWTPGRQIWLASPDGSQAQSLLDESMADHLAFAWRPDGAALAYARVDLSDGPQPIPDVSIWILDLVDREPIFVADDGVLPQWLP